MSDECCSRTCPNPEYTPTTVIDAWGHTFCDPGCADDDAHDTWTAHRLTEGNK